MVLNYIGSKKTLLPFLEHVIKKHASEGSFGDLFAGTGTVGYHFSGLGFDVTANDVEKYSLITNKALLLCPFSDELEQWINELNELDGVAALIYQCFSPGGEAKRMFFTEDNARKADAVRQQIEEWKDDITDEEYCFLLASLLESLDSVANTASVYGAYLKKFKKSALAPLVIKPVHTRREVGNNRVICSDILELKETFSVVYLDPPYVARQYGANYAPLNYVVDYDEKVEVYGKSGLIEYYKSPFASKAKAEDAFKRLFQSVQAEHIFLSYNDQGILSLEKMIDLLAELGDVITYEIDYKRYQARKNQGKKTIEYLHYVKPNNKKKKKRERVKLSFSELT
ncbi:MAG: DNA adenine methylase [Candidatus Thorarchaeota archaeon]|jgi:adenine-specific DNA-methyltransferase